MTDEPPPPPDTGPFASSNPDVTAADGAAATPSREEVRVGLFTTALTDVDRVLHLAESMRVRVMLAGFEAMVLEEQAAAGEGLRADDPAVRGFELHQAQVLRISTVAVQHQLAAARVLRDRLPATAEVFHAGGCALSVASIVVDQVQGLDAPTTAAIDAVAAELVATERAGTVERELTELRDRLDPDGAIGRHRSASNRRYVSARPRRDGQGTLTIETTAADVAAIYDAIRQSAIAAHGREGECRTLGQLMADCAVDMILTAAQTDASAEHAAHASEDAAVTDADAAGAEAPVDGVGDEESVDADAAGPPFPMERFGPVRVPQRKKVQVSLLVTVPAEVATGAANGMASLAGMGTIDAEVALQLVQHTATWTRVLIDPVENAVLGIDSHDRYIPTGLRKLIHARNDTCSMPGCSVPAHRCDLDHATRYEHDGRTRHDNLQALCRRHHLDKDSDYYDVELNPDGTPRWASKWGARWNPRPSLRITTPTTAARPSAVPTTWPEEPPF